MEEGVSETRIDEWSAHSLAQSLAHTRISCEVFLDDTKKVEDGEGNNEQCQEDEAGIDHSVDAFLGKPDGQ